MPSGMADPSVSQPSLWSPRSTFGVSPDSRCVGTDPRTGQRCGNPTIAPNQNQSLVVQLFHQLSRTEPWSNSAERIVHTIVPGLLCETCRRDSGSQIVKAWVLAMNNVRTAGPASNSRSFNSQPSCTPPAGLTPPRDLTPRRPPPSPPIQSRQHLASLHARARILHGRSQSIPDDRTPLPMGTLHRTPGGASLAEMSETINGWILNKRVLAAEACDKPVAAMNVLMNAIEVFQALSWGTMRSRPETRQANAAQRYDEDEDEDEDDDERNEEDGDHGSESESDSEDAE